MVMSAARSVDEYLAELPPERRAVVSAVRDVVRRHLPDGYAESMGFGMITWEVPLERFPDTYNGKPLCYAALAAQKNYTSLYLMGAYGDPARKARLAAEFARAGKKFDAGKSCVRFERLDDLPLDAIGAFIADCPVDAFIASCEAARTDAASRRAAKRPAGKKAATGKNPKDAPKGQ